MDLSGHRVADVDAGPWGIGFDEVEETRAHSVRLRLCGRLDVKADVDWLYRDSNRALADYIPKRLRLPGLGCRVAGSQPASQTVTDLEGEDFKTRVESAAEDEHERWVAERMRVSWVSGSVEDVSQRTHRTSASGRNSKRVQRTSTDRRFGRSLQS